MIKVKNGKVKVKGKYAVLMVELQEIIRALSGCMEKEHIMIAVNDGLKTEEELKEGLEKLLKQLVETPDHNDPRRNG